MIDLLAVTAHPDDLEVCAGGLFLKAKKEGKKTGLIIFTRGESGGYAEQSTREHEAAEGARLLGLDYFKHLNFNDAGVYFGEETVNTLVPLLRECSPKILLTLHKDDYHPDHVAVSRTVDAATFVAGLRKHSKDNTDWKPKELMYFSADYRTNKSKPDILINIEDVIEERNKCCDAHTSQGVTPHAIKAAEYLGRLARCKYAEGLYLRNPLTLNSASGLF
ncbi:MAG: PIG-L family deacetylase [Defluviitaleaceae bacterium]|nr:PIG-L family deacetylase [Defluviitaleaceae bacterium]